MLSSALEGIDSIVQWLDTPAKLQYARQYAHLVNNLFFLRLKQDFWEHYYHIAMTKGLWSLKISNQFAKENSLRRIKFITQSNVNQRRQTVSEELKEAEKKLNTHKQLPSDVSVDMHRLSMVIPAQGCQMYPIVGYSTSFQHFVPQIILYPISTSKSVM